MGDDIIVAGTMNTVVFCDMPGRNVHIFQKYSASELRISYHEGGGYTFVQRPGKFLQDYTMRHATNQYIQDLIMYEVVEWYEMLQNRRQTKAARGGGKNFPNSQITVDSQKTGCEVLSVPV